MNAGAATGMLPSLTVISPVRQSTGRALAEVWRNRELLLVFTRREIKLRYRQTAVGLSWVLLQPLSMMLVLSLFGSLMGVRTGRVPYPLFVLSGLVPWSYFAHALTKVTFSLASQSGLLTKIYFPRLIIPFAAAAGAAVDFFVAALLLPCFMSWYGIRPELPLLALPALVLMAVCTALALGLWLAALNVKYRDVGNALPFLTQIMFFSAPIAYPTTLIPEPWRTVAGLNPVVGLINGFRWCLLGSKSGGLHASVAVSAAVIAVLFTGGILFFRRFESTFIDELG